MKVKTARLGVKDLSVLRDGTFIYSGGPDSLEFVSEEAAIRHSRKTQWKPEYQARNHANNSTHNAQRMQSIVRETNSADYKLPESLRLVVETSPGVFAPKQSMLFPDPLLPISPARSIVRVHNVQINQQPQQQQQSQQAETRVAKTANTHPAPDAAISADSIKKRINGVAERMGSDKERDFHSQEIGNILASNADNPNFSLYDFSTQHLASRGYGDRGMPEHDAAHVLIGTIFHEGQKAGIFKPKDLPDFQTGRHIEVIAFDLETQMSPDGFTINYHRKNQIERLSPFRRDIDKIRGSVASEENYVRSLFCAGS